MGEQAPAWVSSVTFVNRVSGLPVCNAKTTEPHGFGSSGHLPHAAHVLPRGICNLKTTYTQLSDELMEMSIYYHKGMVRAVVEWGGSTTKFPSIPDGAYRLPKGPFNIKHQLWQWTIACSNVLSIQQRYELGFVWIPQTSWNQLKHLWQWSEPTKGDYFVLKMAYPAVVEVRMMAIGWLHHPAEPYCCFCNWVGCTWVSKKNFRTL